MRKNYRVKSEKDFQRVFLEGKSCANRNFVCYQLQKEENKHFRVGFSVGKKIGNAVARNAVKRKMRQVILEIKSNIHTNVDFILIAREGAKDLPLVEMKKNIVHILSLAELMMKKENTGD